MINTVMWAAWPSFHNKVLDTQWPSTVWTPQPTELQEGLAIIFPDVSHTTRINKKLTKRDLLYKEGPIGNPLSSQPEEGFTNRSVLARSGITYENPFISRPRRMARSPRGISSSDWEYTESIAWPATHEIQSEGPRCDEEHGRGLAPEEYTISSPMEGSELPEPQIRNLWQALYEIKRIAAAAARRNIEDQRTYLGEIYDDGMVPSLGFYDWNWHEACYEREITLELVSKLYDALVTGAYAPQFVVPYCPAHLLPNTPNQRLLLSILLTGEGGRL